MTQLSQKQIPFLICLIIPFLILGFIALSNFHAHNSGTLWRVEISGYDPRDLLHGRFLRYQIDWDEYGNVAYHKNSDKALCLNPTEKNKLQPKITYLSESKNCKSVIKAGPDYINWNKRDRRFQIPEKYADTLDKAFRSRKHKFEIDIRVSDSGNLSVLSLFIDGKAMLKALPELEYVHGKTAKAEEIDVYLKLHNFKTFYKSETRQCFHYEIDWAHHGFQQQAYSHTPDLCINKEQDDLTRVSIKPEMGERSCQAILNAGEHNSNWNYKRRTKCLNADAAMFLEKQISAAPNNIFTKASLGETNFLYAYYIYIGTQSLNNAMKNK